MKDDFWEKLESLHKLRKRGVFRITVDDIIAEDLIRFEFCLLNDDVDEFLYELDAWGEGYDVLAQAYTYEQELGIPLSWDTLRRGQVFLYGEFEVVGDKRAPEKFRRKPDNEEFLRIDDIPSFEDAIRRTYSELLKRG